MATTTKEKKGRPAPGGDVSRDAPGRLRVLIVDDMRSNRMQARSMLSGLGYRIEEATNGAEAIEAVERFGPHVVLLDIVMPEMDGITCCKKLKKEMGGRRIKVIMVTGKADYGQMSEAFRAGCDDYITKPIDQKILRNKVAELGKVMLCRQNLSEVLKA